MFVLIRHGDGAMVADMRKGGSSSYTTNIRRAKLYTTKEDAVGDSCGNESPKEISAID